MNPPTQGHEKLVATLQQVASRVGGRAVLFLTQSHDKKNPLPFRMKVDMAKQAFKAYDVAINPANPVTIIDAAKWAARKADNLVFVVGSDRVRDLELLLNKYNGKDYKFKSIKVVSAGQRDPDAEGVEGMSASKLRVFAQQNKWKDYIAGLPSRVGNTMAKKSFETIKRSLNEASKDIAGETHRQHLLKLSKYYKTGKYAVPSPGTKYKVKTGKKVRVSPLAESNETEPKTFNQFVNEDTQQAAAFTRTQGSESIEQHEANINGGQADPTHYRDAQTNRSEQGWSKIRNIRIRGRDVMYKSHHTQATHHFLHDTDA